MLIVNDAFARVFMPGANPLGQVVPYGVHRPVVVGVIAPIKRAASTVADDPAMYMPALQAGEFSSLFPTRGMGVAVGVTGDPMALAPGIREIVRDLGRQLANATPVARGVQLWGQPPALYHLLRGQTRERLLVQAERSVDVQAYLRAWLGLVKAPNAVRVAVDIDPVSFF